LVLDAIIALAVDRHKIVPGNRKMKNIKLQVG
jgi:hypothetical protein